MCMGMQQWMSALLDDGFGPLKEAHRGIHFKDEEAVKTSVHQWLRRQDLCFLPGSNTCPCWKVDQNGGNGWRLYWKVTKLIVNVVVFKQCNCIWVFLKSKGEKKWRHYLLTDPRTMAKKIHKILTFLFRQRILLVFCLRSLHWLCTELKKRLSVKFIGGKVFLTTDLPCRKWPRNNKRST